MTRHYSLQWQLERNCGPDPINPCADLCHVAYGIDDRIKRLEAELAALKITRDNILPAMDRLIANGDA